MSPLIIRWLIVIPILFFVFYLWKKNASEKTKKEGGDGKTEITALIKWLKPFLFLTLVGIIIYITISALPPITFESPYQIQIQRQETEVFHLNKGEEKLTVLVGEGTIHKSVANKPFAILPRSKRLLGSTPEKRDLEKEAIIAPEKEATWHGQGEEDLLRIHSLHEGTVVRFTRIR